VGQRGLAHREALGGGQAPAAAAGGGQVGGGQGAMPLDGTPLRSLARRGLGEHGEGTPALVEADQGVGLEQVPGEVAGTGGNVVEGSERRLRLLPREEGARPLDEAGGGEEGGPVEAPVEAAEVARDAHGARLPGGVGEQAAGGLAADPVVVELPAERPGQLLELDPGAAVDAVPAGQLDELEGRRAVTRGVMEAGGGDGRGGAQRRGGEARDELAVVGQCACVVVGFAGEVGEGPQAPVGEQAACVVARGEVAGGGPLVAPRPGGDAQQEVDLPGAGAVLVGERRQQLAGGREVTGAEGAGDRRVTLGRQGAGGHAGGGGLDRSGRAEGLARQHHPTPLDEDAAGQEEDEQPDRSKGVRQSWLAQDAPPGTRLPAHRQPLARLLIKRWSSSYLVLESGRDSSLPAPGHGCPGAIHSFVQALWVIAR
jgi:hypothetical protein